MKVDFEFDDIAGIDEYIKNGCDRDCEKRCECGRICEDCLYDAFSEYIYDTIYNNILGQEELVDDFMDYYKNMKGKIRNETGE